MSIGSVEDGAKTSDNPSDTTGIKEVILPHQPSTVTLPHPPTNVPPHVPSSGILTSSGIMASPSTCLLQPTGDDNDLSQSAVGRFLNNVQLHDSVLSGIDSDTIKKLQTDVDLGNYVGEHLKQLQQEEVKKCQQEQENKREYAKVIAEDITKKIELIESQQKKKKGQKN